MMKKHIALIACTCIFAASFSGCGGSDKKEEPAQVQTGTNVSVYEVKGGDIESTVSYSGTVVASESVSITSKASAKAQTVYVDEGDYVNAGDVLCNLDSTDIALAYEQALAGYNSAVAGYNSIVNSSSQQSKAQAQQALVNAQTAYDQAKANYDREKTLFENASTIKIATQQYEDVKNMYNRTKQLYEMGAASQLELDTAYSNLVSAEENLKTVTASASASLDNASAALTNAENALANAKNNISLTDTANSSALETAKASVESAKAALNIAQNNLNSTTITTPISGYVSKSSAVAGQNVMAGTEVFVVKNTNIVDVQIDVTESVIPMLYVGSKAVVSVPSAKIYDVDGSVTMVNPVKNDMTGLYRVNITIDNSDGKLNAGMIADITLTTDSAEDIIKIPSDALVYEDDLYYVYIAKGNVAQKVEVTVGIADEKFSEITDGISIGDKVIVDGKEYISEKNNEINISEEYKTE